MEREELARVDQKTRYSGQQKLSVMQDLDVFNAESFFLFYILLTVSKQGINSSVSLALTIIDSEVVVSELLGTANLFRA